MRLYLVVIVWFCITISLKFAFIQIVSDGGWRFVALMVEIFRNKIIIFKMFIKSYFLEFNIYTGNFKYTRSKYPLVV